MKVAVYAIAKDEAKNVRDWYNSMCEADEICVLDTGSTDGTPELLRALGCKVAVQVQEPFRFCDARNASMGMVSQDVDWCVCTDLDERFSKGWREVLEKEVEKRRHLGINALICRFVTAFDEQGKPVNQMDYWKMHRRGCVHWEAPCHEYLVWDEPRVLAFVEPSKMWLEHHPDGEKSRDYYLPMLERAYEDEPTSRTMFYYGRELMFHNRYGAAVGVLSQYLLHPDSTWNSERAWAMRFIARCLHMQGESNVAVRWYVKASMEATDQRESLVEYARMCAELGHFDEAAKSIEIALQRRERPRIFFTEDDCWDGTPERLLVEYKQKAKEAVHDEVA